MHWNLIEPGDKIICINKAIHHYITEGAIYIVKSKVFGEKLFRRVLIQNDYGVTFDYSIKFFKLSYETICKIIGIV